jgi:hypothetical protein
VGEDGTKHGEGKKKKKKKRKTNTLGLTPHTEEYEESEEEDDADEETRLAAAIESAGAKYDHSSSRKFPCIVLIC